MKRSLLLLGAGLLLSLMGLTLAQAGWLPGTGEPTETSQAAPATEDDDSLNSEAVMRYKTCQPRHWRNCLIQH
jgi:hypothetical protein